MLAKKGKREVAVREEEKDHVLNKYAKEHSQKSRCYTCRSLGRYLFLEVQTPTPVSELLPSRAHHPVPGDHTIGQNANIFLQSQRLKLWSMALIWTTCSFLCYLTPSLDPQNIQFTRCLLVAYHVSENTDQQMNNTVLNSRSSQSHRGSIYVYKVVGEELIGADKSWETRKKTAYYMKKAQVNSLCCVLKHKRLFCEMKGLLQRAMLCICSQGMGPSRNQIFWSGWSTGCQSRSGKGWSWRSSRNKQSKNAFNHDLSFSP